MISINDELLRRVANDFDTMFNATIERMKEHQEEKGEVTLKVTIELSKDFINGEDDKQLTVDVPSISHHVKGKWSGGNDFKGAIIEPLLLIGKEKEEYNLIRRRDAQISMFDEE